MLFLFSFIPKYAKKNFHKAFRLRNGLLVDVYRSFRCSMAATSHERDAPGHEVGITARQAMVDEHLSDCNMPKDAWNDTFLTPRGAIVDLKRERKRENEWMNELYWLS